MKSILRLVPVVVGLVLLLNAAPSSGQPVCAYPGCNPTTSDTHFNTAGGTGALPNVDTQSNTLGHLNTAFGWNALLSHTTGTGNTAIGAEALQSNTTGDANTATGNSALRANTTGSYNTASGDALYSNTTGNYNTATGLFALGVNTIGTANTASGSYALQFNLTGNNNTATGAAALQLNSSGERNTALGTNALWQSTGNKNIAIGFRAGINLMRGHNNIYLGSNGVDSTESQTMRLGKAQTRTFIVGINTATVSDATVMIDTATGQLGIATSSARYKEDIAPMGSHSEKVLGLRPVTFAYKDDTRKVTHYGLVAEEVAAVYPDLVTRTARGEVQTVKYHELIPMLLNELQHERQDRRDEVAALRQELAALRALVGARLGQ